MSTTSLAYIFPGQASQYSGMGRDLADNFEAARRVFEEADDALGFSISSVCFEGSAEELQLTENTQPAILTVSVAALRALHGEAAFVPDFVAGHSLGEYSALVAAGALNFSDAVRTVRARGRYMQEAVPVGAGAMAAILGADLKTVMEACVEAQQTDVCMPANINAPGQIVIAGNAGAVDRAIALLKERGAKRAIKLNVSAPFHCPLMMPAQERLAADLEAIVFEDLGRPLVTNVDASIIKAGEGAGEKARDALVRQVSSPVRWQESMELLIQKGVETFIEVGPGKVLSGLLRQIKRDARSLNVEDAASLSATRGALAAA
ncbi:MAG TPA: ACP S-malonyltransferase [Pyrinomonadaceae bacterium]|jgi:[acyl-carrier-protein] S-malonyltransferase|nr:ACP S-malonyltransferase [Pyrinomonadaceae bacterium]